MDDNREELDSLESLAQNAVAQTANLGAFSFAVSPITELTQMTLNKTNKVNNSLDKKDDEEYNPEEE